MEHDAAATEAAFRLQTLAAATTEVLLWKVSRVTPLLPAAARTERLRGVDMVRQWRIMIRVEFVETPTFTRLIGKLMDDSEYAKMQLALVLRPDWGKVIPGGGGLRKLRWAGSGRGKRGGLRVIYYWQTADDQIWLLVAFRRASATICRMMRSSN